jgi:serine/threonine protein kinase
VTINPASAESLISPGIDAVGLFDRASAVFSDLVEVEQLVAASPVRALFVARDIVLKRRVALRIHLAPESPTRKWFLCETELLAALDHAALRAVYSAGQRHEWAYRLAKWIDGESLRAAAARGPRPVPSALALARDLLGLLEYVHSHQIVVRRIVPETVMIQSTGRHIVTDLRYANRCLDLVTFRDPAGSAFLAPEVRDGAVGDPSSDVYGAGAVLYFAITGAEPALDPRHLTPPRQLRPACPRALERVIVRALRPAPSDRFFTAVQMEDDLVSDLGEFDTQIPVAPPLGAATEDARAWEKRLRRALGDEYELLEEIGAGGFGRVYRVRDLGLERDVALKVLHPYLTTDPAVVERFRREAQFAARFMHPHIVNVHDIGGRGGLIWYTMEYVPGTDLARLVEVHGPQPVDRVLRLLDEGLSALQAAHERGLMHRDLKPENMLIEAASGNLLIADFGLALALGGPDRRGGASGARSGTPEYAAPEQLLGEPVDHRADLYAISLAAVYALTGEPPFGTGAPEALLARKLAGEVPAVRGRRPDVPEALARMLARGAARHPADRFQNAGEYQRALQRLRRRWRLSPVRWLQDRLPKR